MQIKSTHRAQPRQALPKEGLTPKGKLDRQLAEGVTDVVDLGTSRTEYGKSKVKRDFGSTAFHHGVLGGALGLAMTNISPIGGLAGLGLGAYIAWNKTARKDSGAVKIQLDGETRRTRYYDRPENYIKTPQEVRAEMLSRGQLGEKIKPHTPQGVVGATPDFSTAEQKTLKNLASERRLVADFGQKSEYGYQVLNQIDSLTAARLIEADNEVFLLDGKSKDVTHTLEVVANNSRSTVRRHEADSYLERTYDYTLTPLSRENLNSQSQGVGLPEGFHGVYKNQQSCALVIGEDQQAGVGMADKNSRSTSFNYRRVTRDQNVDLGRQDKARVVTTSSINIRDLVMMSGVLVGMLSAMGISPGVPQAALIGGVSGGVIGRELGWLAQDRMPRFQTRR